LATPVTMTADGLVANLVPLEYDPDDGAHGTLRGHVARANPVWREALSQHEALAVFHRPQGYISPGWYPSKRAHGKVVPTWNYAVVQARGRLQSVDDAPWLRALVGRLTDRHEGRRAHAGAAPWKVQDAQDDYVAQMLRAIVGIEIAVARLEGKWKLSQNRHEADRRGVFEGLTAEGSALAGWIPR
jgi:transcriptional regulator